MHVRATLANPAHAAYLEDAAALASAVATLGRAAYGGEQSPLESAEPTITWRSLARHVELTAYPDGRLTWRLDSLATPAMETTGAEMLIQALEAIRAAHVMPSWPAKLVADSVRFSLTIDELPEPVADGDVRHPAAWSRAAIFTLRLPAVAMADDLRDNPIPHYPELNLYRGMEGKVTVDFVIDSAGHVEPDSFEPHGAEAIARMSPAYQRAYREFVGNIRTSVMASRFIPAQVAGCPTRMPVAKAFEFRVQ
jgi:hypothetical protein